MKLVPVALALAIAFIVPLVSSAESPKAHSLPGNIFVGYQGWFRCPNDGSPKSAWSHWSKNSPSAETVSIDLYPELSELDKSSLCPVPGMTIGGKQAYVFSSFPEATTRKHFEWMREYDIDGAFLQRFINDIPRLHAENDQILQHVRKAAEATGRTFLVEYDLSGAHAETVLSQLQDDWSYLNRDLKIVDSHAYIRDHGKPVVALWGLGFGDRSHLQDPALALGIVKWYQSQGCTVIGGVPARWRTLTMDSSTNLAWNNVYDAIDIVQPWTVGRYSSPQEADSWKEDALVGDVERTRLHGQLYMPVIFPGFSWHNLNRNSPENQIPRRGGDFLWRQAMNAKSVGAPLVKIAMFDEVNEGTAIFKAASTRMQAPEQGYWLTLDADGMHLPDDWYLQLARAIATLFRGTLAGSARMPIAP